MSSREAATCTFEEFPPRPTRPSEVAACVEILASVVAGRSATYVSSPLTTGQRAFEWHQRNGIAGAPQSADDFRRDVIERNRAQAAAYVGELRKKVEGVVIDPTAMADIPDWTQSDYRFLWGIVIERYVHTVVLRDGWEHSSGCAYEFLVGHASHLRILREDLHVLSPEEAQRLIASAIEARDAHQVSPRFLVHVLDALHDPSAYGGRR